MNLALPSMERAVACRIDMDLALAESARTLLGIREDGSTTGDDFTATGRIDALDYGAYCDLAFAEGLRDPAARTCAARFLEDRLPGFSRAAIEGLARTGVGGEPRIRALSPQHFTSAEIDCMVRWWDNEPANHLALSAPGPVEFEQTRRTIGTALDRLRLCATELFAEMIAIVRDIVVARSGSASRMGFSGGATSFALWGSILVDPVSEFRWPQMYRMLVHETAHNLLFALARKEPLVGNDPAERFASPLRSDPRPMDGVYHAAFVSMRESLALDALLVWQDEAGQLNENDAAGAFAMLETSVVAFWECEAILRRDADLTPLGDAILSDCVAFMDANFALAPA